MLGYEMLYEWDYVGALSSLEVLEDMDLFEHILSSHSILLCIFGLIEIIIIVQKLLQVHFFGYEPLSINLWPD